MKRAVFAGTFDPFTKGHYEIVERASKLYGEITVGVAEVSSNKRSAKEIFKRLEIASVSVKNLPNVTVKPFSGFLVDFLKSEETNILVRGLRTANDFEYEKALNEVYRTQYQEIECVYLISSHKFNHISGSVVRDLASLGGGVSEFVCSGAVNLVEKYYKI